MAPPRTVGTDRAFGVLLGAAVGDALGWPQEMRSSIVGGQKAREVPPEPHFREWRRNSGTRFIRYEETVLPGQYSDDTQLLLAVARSCLKGPGWLRYFSHVELPTWLLYQRGGGRAILSSARAWANDHAPWSEGNISRTENAGSSIASYFNAGANGAAMRIAPHAIVADDIPAVDFMQRILLDSIATHGHPRALVGAVIHGLALRNALAHEGTLEYGSLIDSLLYDETWQSGDQLQYIFPQDWLQAYEKSVGRAVNAVWANTVTETLDLLLIAQRSLERGALANDGQTLHALGVFDKSRNGAGTITAVAAIYIAARAAARPLSGLLRAAYLSHADTDTLASMCASLLGAIHGSSWLSPLGEEVQDAEYLKQLSMRLADRELATEQQAGLFPGEELHGAVYARDIERFRRSVLDMRSRFPEVLPDGRRIKNGRVQESKSLDGTLTRALLQIDGGQTLVIDKYTKHRNVKSTTASEEEHRVDPSLRGHESRPSASLAKVVQIRLRVSDLETTIRFYRDVLNVSVERISVDSAQLSGGLTLTQLTRSESRDHELSRDLLIRVSVPNFDETVQHIMESGVIEVLSLTGSGAFRQLRLRDPDGHDLQIIPVEQEA